MANEDAQNIIAIDGPSGTGKSTTAKMVAKELGWTYLDTGAMYRAAAWVAENEKVASDQWLVASITFDKNNQILIDGVNRENEIRDPRVSAVVSKYSALPAVREFLTKKQREIGSEQPCVLDGRDIGTVVFPKAKHKFFLTADYKTRAERRLLELQAAGNESETLETVEKNLKERDELDSKREIAPLLKAKDAIEIDTSRITIQQQVQKVLQSVREVARCKDSLNTTQKVTMSKQTLKAGSQEDLDEILNAEQENKGLIATTESMEAYNNTLKDFKEEVVIEGIIRQVNDLEVFVDVKGKSEGIIPREEFKEGEPIYVGSKIEVYIDKFENDDGRLVLSKQKADFLRIWEQVYAAYERGDIVRGALSRRIKGGVEVDLFGISAFLPGSQIDLRQIPDINIMIGQEYDLKIIKINKDRRNIVVSRRVVLEDERNKQRGNVLDTLEKNQVRKGIVKNITEFGAFIDLGGVDGLLHITDMSYKRINDPKEIVQIGQEVEVVILDYNDKKERISLGIKQLHPHPWKDVAERYPEGAKVKGRIVSVTDYGAFVELESGLEGLIHVSEMFWSAHLQHPNKLFTVGQDIEAVVLKVEAENERISLGTKQLEADPWESIESELLPGAKVTGEVRSIATFGAFVEIKEGVDGLIHVSDMSWTKKIDHPSEIIKKGDKVECVVLAVDSERRRISLSMKHLEDDPWDSVDSDFQVGAEIKGKIIRLIDRGAIIELVRGFEGLVPVSKLGTDYIKVPAEAFKVGDEVPAVVTELNNSQRTIYLSAADYFKNRSDEHAAWKEAHKPGMHVTEKKKKEKKKEKEEKAS
ncbi:MAG: (d)CMP kinase [Fibromonadaceae bacterium]|jgi:small subunit ribosomal protein S1|nr:(d)CMP kinase [Fibromonadaceae bacterium]